MQYGYNTNKRNLKEVVRNENNSFNIDIKLLKELYNIQSPSKYEGAMINFITSYIESNIPNTSVVKDHLGNLLITKGVLNEGEYYPCMVAHMDEVPDFNANRQIVHHGEFIFSICTKTGMRDGLGADDKNGIYIALEMLHRFEKLKVFFSVGEEVGLVGTYGVKLSFFDNVGYMLQCDRRGHSDLITYTNGLNVMSDDMIYQILDICEAYEYSEANGTCTDIGGLKSRGVDVCACNISCGYYDEHTDEEFCYLPAIENCANFVYNILIECKNNKFEHSSKSYDKKKHSYHKSYTNYNYYDDYSDYYSDSDDYDYTRWWNNHGDEESEKGETMEDVCLNCQYECMRCPYFNK